MTQTNKEAFEQWFANCPDLMALYAFMPAKEADAIAGCTYHDDEVETAWRAWNASLARAIALVELGSLHGTWQEAIRSLRDGDSTVPSDLVGPP